MKVQVNEKKLIKEFEPIELTLIIQTESELVDLFNRVSARPELWYKDKEYKDHKVNDIDTQVLYDTLSEFITSRKIQYKRVELIQEDNAIEYV